MQKREPPLFQERLDELDILRNADHGAGSGYDAVGPRVSGPQKGEKLADFKSSESTMIKRA